MAAMPRSLGAIVLCAALGCSDPSAAEAVDPVEPVETPADEATDDRPQPAVDHLPRVDSPQDWRRLAARSQEHAIARTEVVKVLLDHRAAALYFAQSERWPIHYDFAVRFLQTEARALGDRREFNQRNYLRPDREMQMASVVHYRDGDHWTLELGPADNLEGERLLALFERVRGAVFFGDRLRYRPRSELHRRRMRAVADRLPHVDVGELWAGVRYQPVTLGAVVGRVRVVRGALDPSSVRPDEIVVLETVPDDLPVCAGVITAELQAPLAHIAVLSQSRGTPNMALRGARGEPRIAAVEDRIARLEVRADDFTLEPADAAALARSLGERRPPPVDAPPIDRDRGELTDVCDLRLGDGGWAGAKAAQLGEICTLAGVETPGGFVVPIAHYLAHMREIEVAAASLRADPGFDDGRVRDRRLAGLRERIVAAPIDGALVDSIVRRLRSMRGRRWIFRSSTNAEDLPGFSGAGLYRSIVTPADPDADVVARALCEVWASVYERRAWDEREWYGVDHDAVGMAVLVQPLVSEVVAMGVAITENPFSSSRSGMLVDLAPAGGSVTAAEGGELPEQILLYRRSRPEVISRSTRNGGRPLLAQAQMRPLTELLDRIHAHLVPLWGARADAADVELALVRGGRVVVLQARPYRMRRGP